MSRARGNEPAAKIDWLPWSLSIFGACCAVFVLVRGVLPERAVNRELVQRVARLESDLSRVRQEAASEVTRAKEQLSAQALAVQAEVSVVREQERARAAREAARRDLGQSLASEIEAEDVLIQERAGELVVILRDRLMFYGNSSLIETRGKRALRQLSGSMHRLPAEQVYRISARTERQERAIARFLEIGGRIPRAQLATAGAPPLTPGSIEIVLTSRKP